MDLSGLSARVVVGREGSPEEGAGKDERRVLEVRARTRVTCSGGGGREEAAAPQDVLAGRLTGSGGVGGAEKGLGRLNEE